LLVDLKNSFQNTVHVDCFVEDSSWNVVAHGDAWEGKWRGNWRMEWVASTLHTTSEHGVSSITTADVHTLAAGSRRNWCPRWFKWTRPLCWKTKSGFCACAITFQLASTTLSWDEVKTCYWDTEHCIRQHSFIVVGLIVLSLPYFDNFTCWIY